MVAIRPGLTVAEAAGRWLGSYVDLQRAGQGRRLAEQRVRDYLSPAPPITVAMIQATIVLDRLSWREPPEDPVGLTPSSFGRELYGSKKSVARPAVNMLRRLVAAKLAAAYAPPRCSFRYEITPTGDRLAMAALLARRLK